MALEMFNGEHPCQADADKPTMIAQVIYSLKQNKQKMSAGLYKLLESMLQIQSETRIQARQAMGNQILPQPALVFDDSMLISKQIIAFSKINQLQKMVFAILVHQFTKQQRKLDLQILFTQLDNDGDGFVAKQDIKQMFKNVYISSQPAKKLLREKNDQNGTAQHYKKKENSQLDITRPITYADVGKIFPSITYRQVGSLEFYEFLAIMQFSEINQEDLDIALKLSFNVLDIDTKNYLNYNDFVRAFNNKKNDPKEIKNLFMQIDESNDNHVNYEELKEVVSLNK